MTATPEQTAAGNALWDAVVARAHALLDEKAAEEGLTFGAEERLLMEAGVSAGIVAAWTEAADRGLLRQPPEDP